MNRSSARRLWVYGLLLLLPALAVGGLSLALLNREQSRLTERELAARESRQAAVESRARLIAENIELLVGDVQSALMDTLRAAPAAEPRPFLTEWQATNPLVSDVFRATAEGRPVWGATSTPLRAWLAQGGPWGQHAPAPTSPSSPALATDGATDGFAAVVSAPGTTRAKDESTAPAPSSGRADARRNITDNVSQYQRARQEIQEVAKVKNYADIEAKSSASQPEPSADAFAFSSSRVVSAPTASLPADKAAAAERGGLNRVVAETVAGSVAGAALADAAPRYPAKTAKAVATLESREALGATAAAPGARSGWSPWRDAAGLHLFGWRELPDRTVVGLELRLDAIRSRLGEVFPAQPGADEAYALRDTTGQDWHTVGGSALPIALEVPLAAAALPGWTVVGFTRDAGYDSNSTGGFFALGATLIALLVLAILAAGALLLRQARRSEAEAALKTSFVANVSHELKTPLTTIRLYAELLAQGRVREPAKQADYLATIGRETQRLARLVGNVLDFSRLEEGKKKYDHTAFDLAVELRRLADTHGPRLANAGLALHVELPATQDVATDRDALEQIVLNLFDNACKYAADGGSVTLRLEVDQTRVYVIVADRGPGVEADQRERVFDKFHRVDERLTAEKGGAGLGLSIARQLARGLAGDLCCRPRVGGGAEFVLTLPLKILSA